MNNKRSLLSFLGSQWGQRVSILVVVCIVMGIMQPKFFSLNNVNSILLSISVYGIMSCGMLFAILAGGIDLCIGSEAGMAAVLMTQFVMKHNYSTMSVIVGILIAMAACALLGFFHGIQAAYMKIPSFILTIATQYAVYGAMNVYTGSHYLTAENRGLYGFIGTGKIAGIPTPIIIFIVYVILASIILGCTKFGRRVYIVGGNPEAAELLGINSRMYQVVTFMIAGASAAFGGAVLACINLRAAYTTGAGYEGNVLTAMVVGGINLAGGEGGIPGAIFGALFVGIINNLLILLNIPSDYQKFIQGIIIVVAIALNVQTARRAKGIGGKVSMKLFETKE